MVLKGFKLLNYTIQRACLVAAGEGNENYTIVAGNRRFNACKGWMEIPSRIVEADDNGKTSPDKSFRPRERWEGTESGIGKEFRYSNLIPTTGY